MSYYDGIMHRHDFKWLLVRTSLLSAIICSILAFTIPIGVNWSFILSNNLIHNYIFGSNGLVEIIRNSRGINSATVGQTLSNDELKHSISIILGTIVAVVII